MKAEAGRVDRCETVEVICLEILRGKGTPEDPFRVVTYFYETDGSLIAEQDSLAKKEESE